jgi:hypothetical protein
LYFGVASLLDLRSVARLAEVAAAGAISFVVNGQGRRWMLRWLRALMTVILGPLLVWMEAVRKVVDEVINRPSLGFVDRTSEIKSSRRRHQGVKISPDTTHCCSLPAANILYYLGLRYTST